MTSSYLQCQIPSAPLTFGLLLTKDMLAVVQVSIASMFSVMAILFTNSSSIFAVPSVFMTILSLVFLYGYIMKNVYIIFAHLAAQIVILILPITSMFFFLFKAIASRHPYKFEVSEKNDLEIGPFYGFVITLISLVSYLWHIEMTISVLKYVKSQKEQRKFQLVRHFVCEDELRKGRNNEYI